MTAPQKKARLRKLNGDTTWLLQIPLSERKTYNLVSSLAGAIKLPVTAADTLSLLFTSSSTRGCLQVAK